MRNLVISFCVLAIIVFWVLTLLVLIGTYQIDQIEPLFGLVRRPKNTAELGDSLNIFVGLISTLTMLVAVYAVRLQAKALEASINSQNDQQRALTEQLARQEITSLIASYTAQIQMLASDRQWYQHLIDQYRAIREGQTDPAKQQETQDKMDRCRKRNSEIKDSMNELNQKVAILSARLEKGN